MGQTTMALEWYNILASIVPTDPEILLRLGKLLCKENDKSQAYHYFSEVFL
jgi:intraflagellar transport protein 88